MTYNMFAGTLNLIQSIYSYAEEIKASLVYIICNLVMKLYWDCDEVTVASVEC